MVGWHYQLSGHEYEQTPGDSEGQGSLVCFSLWSQKELDTTQGLNNKNGAAIVENNMEGPQKIKYRFTI